MRKKYKPKRENRTFWIVSSGRCGSKSIAYILNEAQNTHVYHEPVWTQADLNMWSPIYRQYQLKEKGSLGKNWLKDMKMRFLHNRGQMVWEAHEVGKIYGETSPVMFAFMPALKDLYLEKGAKFIHLVRHPYYQVRSMVHFGWWSPNKDKAVGRIDAAPDEFEGYENDWSKMDVTMKNLWYWIEKQKQIIADFEDIPEDQKRIFRLEDFSVPSFKWLYEWLNLEPHRTGRTDQILTDDLEGEIKEELTKRREDWALRMEEQMASKRHKFPETAWMTHWVNWDEEHTKMFQELCEGLMEYFGYEWDY